MSTAQSAPTAVDVIAAALRRLIAEEGEPAARERLHPISRLMQKPDAVAQLPLEIQRQVFAGIEKDNERQYELVKKQMDLSDKVRIEQMQERTAARTAAADERWKIRKVFLIGGCILVGVIGAIFVFMMATGHETSAMALLDNVMKVGSGAIGGAGSATVYQRAKTCA